MPTPPDQSPAFSFNSAPTAQQARQLIGDRVRTARMAANLTQQELAGTTYSKSYISAIERGKMTPSLPALGILAERLGVTLSYLLGEELSRPADEAPEAPAENGERAARLREAELVLQEGRYEEAIALFEDIGQHDQIRWTHERYAEVLAAQGRYQEAYEQMGLARQGRV
jgi:transcriptional regulator with XRE-family HTH domain